MSAVSSTDFDIVDILKKFIKVFDLFLFCRKQHIGLSANLVWRFIQCRQSVPQTLI